jgi:TRAP-type C4-dicarboxylate transport system permease large subunit
MVKVYNFFGGRCTFFALLFITSGIALAFMGKLNGDYVAMAAATQTLLVAHSAKEDYFQSGQSTTVTVTTGATSGPACPPAS